ncbi:MAG: hypothetical protein AAB386_05385 [Patescibacteria group bacterium]
MKLLRGYIALISIILIEAILLVIGAGILLRSSGVAKTDVSIDKQARAQAAVSACADYALNQLKETTVYTGNQLINVGGDTCYIMNVSGIGGTNRTVQATSTVSGYTRKIKIQITKVNPTMIISSWEDVVGF